jgi:hypothetical protein
LCCFSIIFLGFPGSLSLLLLEGLLPFCSISLCPTWPLPNTFQNCMSELILSFCKASPFSHSSRPRLGPHLLQICLFLMHNLFLLRLPTPQGQDKAINFLDLSLLPTNVILRPEQLFYSKFLKLSFINKAPIFTYLIRNPEFDKCQ